MSRGIDITEDPYFVAITYQLQRKDEIVLSKSDACITGVCQDVGISCSVVQ